MFRKLFKPSADASQRTWRIIKPTEIDTPLKQNESKIAFIFSPQDGAISALVHTHPKHGYLKLTDETLSSDELRRLKAISVNNELNATTIAFLDQLVEKEKAMGRLISFSEAIKDTVMMDAFSQIVDISDDDDHDNGCMIS